MSLCNIYFEHAQKAAVLSIFISIHNLNYNLIKLYISIYLFILIN